MMMVYGFEKYEFEKSICHKGTSFSPAIVTDPAQLAQPAVEPGAPVPKQETIAEPASEPANIQ